MRILVCGSRGASTSFVVDRLDHLLGQVYRGTKTIIHGAARGADTGAGMLARHLGLFEESYPAAWERDGKAAGPIRNQRMLDEGDPDRVIAFWDGKSKGTLDMISRATAAGIQVWIEPLQSQEPAQGELGL